MPQDEEDEQSPRLIQRTAAAAVGGVIAERLVPGGGILGAAAVPVLEQLARHVWDEFRPDSQRRQAEMLGAAAGAAKQDPEELAEKIGKSEHSRLLTATAMVGAAGTAWPDKVYAIGRALADGLIAMEDGKPNIADLVLPAMADMERQHIVLLDLLARYEPQQTGPTNWGASLYTERNPAYRGGRHDRRRWTFVAMTSARPGVAPVITGLLGTLERHGLAAQNDNTAEALANFSRASAEDIRRRTLRGGGGRATVPAAPKAISGMGLDRIVPETSWSATDLGEKVLRYYWEAGELHRHAWPMGATSAGGSLGPCCSVQSSRSTGPRGLT